MSEQITVMGSRLQLSSARHLPRFLAGTMRINRQLRRAPGRIDSRLRADFGSLTFWTLSTWEDERSLHAFARTDPHAVVISGLRDSGAMKAAGFAFWSVHRDDSLPGWAEVEERVALALSR